MLRKRTRGGEARDYSRTQVGAHALGQPSRGLAQHAGERLGLEQQPLVPAYLKSRRRAHPSALRGRCASVVAVAEPRDGRRPRPPTPVALPNPLSKLRDTRIERTMKHSMTDILVIALCGFIWEGDEWVELPAFGQAKQEWSMTFLSLPNGLPRAARSGDSSPRSTRRSSRRASPPG